MVSGKSMLLDEFMREAAAGGALTLVACASRAEQALSPGVMAQIFHRASLPDEFAERAEQLFGSGGLGTDPADADPPTIRDSHLRLMHELCRLLLDLAERQPVVIAVDDVQFADEASLQALLYFQRRLRAARVLVVLTEWSHHHITSPLFRAELLRNRQCRQIQLEPFCQRGVVELLATKLDAESAARLGPDCHRLTGGNPVLVHAFIEDQLGAAEPDTPGEAPAPVVGPAYRQAVLMCLPRWEPAILECARALAVLGGNASPADLGALLGIKPKAASQNIELLTAAGLLDGGRFRHPAAVEAVFDSFEPGQLEHLHLSAAQVLHDHGAGSAAIARHLVAAGAVPEGWGFAVLRRAAEQAIVADEVEQAMEFLDLARLTATDDHDRAVSTVRLVRAQWRVNPSAAARHLPALVEAFEAGILSKEDAMMLVRHLLWHGQAQDAAKVISGLAGDDDSSAHTAWVEHLRPPLFSTLPEGVAELGEADLDKGADGLRLRASAALRSVLAGKADDEIIASVEQILQSCLLDDTTFDSVTSALRASIYADKADRAVRWCESLSGEASSRNATTWRAVLAGVWAEAAIHQGDLVAAERHTRSALELMSPQSWGVAVAAPLGARVLALTGMGRYDEADRLLKRVVPPAGSQSRFGLFYQFSRGIYYLATNRLYAAVSDFKRCGELLVEAQLDYPAYVPWRGALARTYLRLGRREEARSLIEEQLALPGAEGKRIRGASLRTLTAASDLRQRLPLLREAVELLQTSGDQLELARALADMSHAHYTLGEHRRARMLARRAMQMAKSCGADALWQNLLSSPAVLEPDSAKVAALAPVAPTTPGSGSDELALLSEAERRVAVFAARGHTNREISRKLYITVSTVEQHLTRIYKKLHVDSRSALPAGLQLEVAGTA